MKLTDWFPGDIKPIRVGIYERRYSESINFSKWNGEYWSFGYYSVDLANERGHYLSQYQNLPWRGLAEDPNK